MYARLLSHKKWSLLLIFLLLSAALVACGGTAEAPTTTGAPMATEPPEAEPETTLTVFAAASLTDAFTEIAAAFDSDNPGVTTVFNFAGSNQLATQINEGAPADVFASANQMDAAVESGRIDADAPTVFVTNRLVVVIPADNPGDIQTLQDLANPGTLIVLAAAEVPVGKYSLEFLDKASADPAFSETFREDVLANVNKVSLGEADAGIVYTSDLVGVEGVSGLEIPDELNLVAEYPIAILNDSANSEMAAAFVEFVLSDGGRALLAEYGFGPGTGQ
ncbi:MAG: molybdate ABC transporter substrate-binding protein [Anaerolineae bacterium]|nr:MAG: molybdate ABC transporter substrate-binding protein [Anaerolineae bacterium]